MLAALLKKCRWKQRHLLGIKDLSREEILCILELARGLKDEKDLGAPLKGRRLFNFFAESSARTKTSFGIAARALDAVRRRVEKSFAIDFENCK